MSIMLDAQNVTKTFGGLVALQKVGFHIEEEEILGLIGANGAGKTTAFNIITGFHKADSGLIKFMGEDISGLSPSHICKKGIARTFQTLRPFLNVSVIDNITCGALCRTNSLDISKQEASKIIQWIGLNRKQDTLVRSLTLFERKLVEIGRALATRPRLLLVDEAAAGLNPTEIKLFAQLVREIRGSGVTLVLVEHVMRFVMEVSERIVVLDYGCKIAEGTPEEVSRNEKVIKAYLGEPYA